jgi:hypothetical protein
MFFGCLIEPSIFLFAHTRFMAKGFFEQFRLAHLLFKRTFILDFPSLAVNQEPHTTSAAISGIQQLMQPSSPRP